jgi:hypothetical protein
MRCHDSIAQLASALAKAQIELVNPPKSLTAHLEGPETALAKVTAMRRSQPGWTLSARPSASTKEWDSGLVVLTTTLAHGSGEWIAARWQCAASPMCGREPWHSVFGNGARHTLHHVCSQLLIRCFEDG